MVSAIKRARKIFRNHDGVLRSKEAVIAGVHWETLYKMRDSGMLERLDRGLYKLRETEELSRPDLVTVAHKVSRGVICLISALSYHEITTQIPHAVDVAITPGMRPAVIEHPPVNYHWFSRASHEAGVEEHKISGIKVKIYSVEKTLADCFKFRNKIGLDTAVEALNLYSRSRRVNVTEIMKYARICRVAGVMRPYLEAII